MNGGAPGAALTDGGIASIDTQRLIRDPSNGCNPVMPVGFRPRQQHLQRHSPGWRIRGMVRQAPRVRPRSPPVLAPAALDDFYAPEINSTVIALPGVTTPTGVSCATILDPGSDLTAWTNSFQNIQCYDTLKVDAILNEIDGKNHLGTKTDPSSHHLRHELPGRQRRPEAR